MTLGAGDRASSPSQKSSRAQVAIFFDDRLLRGNRAVKSDTHGLEGFVSPNFPPLAVATLSPTQTCGASQFSGQTSKQPP